MATYTKNIQTQLITWADITNTNQTISSVVDVSTKLGALVLIHMGRRSGTAFTAGWPNLRVEVSGKASGNDAWYPVQIFTPAIGASIANTTLNGAVSAAATSCVVTSATNIAAGDILFLGHTTTVANYELVRVKSVSGTTVNFEEACTNAHDNTAPVTDQAEMYVCDLDLRDITRIRVVADNANSGQTCAYEVSLITGDAIG